MFKRTAASLIALGLITGCTAFPENYNEDPGVPEIVEEYNDAWSHEVPLRYVQSTSGASVNRYFTLPEKIANKPVVIDIDYDMGATVGDLIYALRAQGYRVVSRLNESEEAPLLLHRFNGTLGDFVEDLSQVQNIAYEYRNGTLFILEANRYSVSLPQHEELLLQVATSLIEMGATDVRTDLLAGMVHFSAKPDISDYVTEYLDRIAQNSAMVRLQVAVVTVGLNRDLSRGIDWSQVMGKVGSGDMRPVHSGAVGQSNSSAPYAVGQALSFMGGSGFAYAFNSSRFSLSAIVRALSEFGTTRTEQNVVLGTVSGMPVRISSGNDIPYVKKIGSVTASGGSISGSTETDIIRSGLELEITPNFDSSDASIVTTVKVNMSSLVGFRELSAGANLGTLSQPEMQNLEFENVGRLQAGETIVIGGITYDQMNENYTSLPFLERAPVGSKSQKTNKNAIYIVIRPTVVIFSRDADRMNRELAEAARRGQPPQLNLEVQSGKIEHEPRPITYDLPKAPSKSEQEKLGELKPIKEVEMPEIEVVERVKKVEGGEIRVREYREIQPKKTNQEVKTDASKEVDVEVTIDTEQVSEVLKENQTKEAQPITLAVKPSQFSQYQTERRLLATARAQNQTSYAPLMYKQIVADASVPVGDKLPAPYIGH